MRPRISVYVAMSLDGFIAGPDGELGWLEGAAAAGEDYGFADFLGGVDAVAMGRRTWDVIAGIDDLPYGDRPLYVFTHRPAPARAGVTFWQREPGAAVEDWVERGHRAVYVDGGALISAFLAEGLVDDLIITVVPTLLGEGLPLFHARRHATALEVTGVQQWPSGMVQLRYRRA